MTGEDRTPQTARTARPLPDHPVRIALLDLLAEVGTLTSTQAAARLGHSSGLCSFHLRQLARHGLIEEAPHDGRRDRPWRLLWDTPERTPAPESMSATLHLTADEAAELGAAIRELFASYEHRTTRPAHATPVTATARLEPVRATAR
ncbi:MULTISPECIES: winged helix-turn-helix domain-containing protein [unclassified Streptomyces]|uniref:winged helix-turn-helix domain-containing protein n=1 Tax=unclassified Streptomyces TaxID=2593676 RepID=UPI00037800B3|nr:winged helix-turn-helix domain-containing protein [Streptomyces sp. HmicA12]